MGYTTNFEGSFALDKPLTLQHFNYLKAFNETRRMKRDSEIAEQLEDKIREAAELPIGKDGEFFISGSGYAGQDDDKSVVDHNCSPSTQPGLWCQWVPSDNGDEIVWDGGEKFYDYIEWIEYLVVNFLAPWGYVVDGTVNWQGEEIGDIGSINISNNNVSVSEGFLSTSKPENELSKEDTDNLLEIARIAFGDADIFDAAVDTMDITDNEMNDLRDKLYKYLGK